MPKTYTTRQGDTFESIAYFAMGDSGKMVDLIRENRKYMDTAIFDAGVELLLPEYTEEQNAASAESTVPWR